MTIDEATLMAYLDGELDAQGVAQVDAAMTRDAELAARIARQRRLDARLRTSHVAAAQTPVPDALLQWVLGTGAASKADASEATTALGHVVAFAPRKRARTVWTHLGALAAGIVLAVIALPWLRGPREADWVQGSDGLRARGELAAALDDQLSVDRAGRVQVALSFRDQGGRYCRAFSMASARTAGLACRDGQGWSLPVLAHEEEPAQGTMRQAASPLPAAVLGAVDARIAGEALDAKGEQAARKVGWHP